MADSVNAVVVGKVMKSELSAGDFVPDSGGEKINYRNWKLTLFSQDPLALTEVKLPGSLGDEIGVPGVGDDVAFHVVIRYFRGNFDVKVAGHAPLPRSASNGAPPAPPAARSGAKG